MRKAVSRIIPNRQWSLNNLNGSTVSTGSLTNQVSTNTTTPNSSSNSPFKIDFNSVSDFYIVLDNPHNSWLPGDEVSGQIILISKKNLADVVITLSLIGYVKINTISHSKLRPTRHNLFNYTIKIYGEDIQNRQPNDSFSNGLFKGEHRFPFIVKLPNKRIFTSIDFGKGSITYVLRANMSDGNNQSQQPESPGSPGFLSKTKGLKLLNNTNYTSEKLINLINPIDVSTLPTPKTKRLIIKDPRYNRRLSRTQSSNSTINTFNTFSTLSSNNSDQNSVSESPRGEESHGEDTHNQYHQHSSAPLTQQSNNSPGDELSNDASTPHNSSVSYDVNTKPDTIKVLLNLPKRGYLRGELIPIKLSINHLRKIQDLNGIIITLVRVCRMDNGPDGIYDSFRKDLAQLVIPLYVDPTTFKSEISTSIRVPADAFPTISGCPLVSFQYFIEVLINLSGKTVVLTDGDQAKSSVVSDSGRQSPIVDFSATNGQLADDSASTMNNNVSNISDLRNLYRYLTTATDLNLKERSNFVNTDKYKRMKKFLQLTSEVIVGTHRLVQENEAHHSSANGAAEIHASNSPLTRSRRSSSVSDGSPAIPNPSGSNNGVQTLHYPIQGSTQPTFNSIPESVEMNNFDNAVPNYNEIVNNDNMDLMPMPQQDGLSEKERIRAHERALLPSEPPLDMSDVDSRDSISPVDENEVNFEEHPSLQANQTQHQEHQQPPQQNIQGQALENGNDFNFFAVPETDNQQPRDRDDQYSQIDYVPNYEGSNNDTLIEGTSHSET